MKKIEKKEIIPDAVIARLPQYCRELIAMKAQYITVTSSEKLAQRMGVTPEQIRKDLNFFGALGHKGVGYIVDELLQHLRSIIGLNKSWSIAIAGVGNIGKALMNYGGWKAEGFEVTRAFARNPELIGTTVSGIKVESIAHIRESLQTSPVDIVAITVRSEVAQHIADEVVAADIKGLWLFASDRIEVPDDVTVIRADLWQSISVLAYHLNNK